MNPIRYYTLDLTPRLWVLMNRRPITPRTARQLSDAVAVERRRQLRARRRRRA